VSASDEECRAVEEEENMKAKRKIIRIDEDLCDGCGACVPSCAEGAIELVDNKARVVAEKYCDGLGACLRECPKGALTVEEREAEEFDETAVEEHLSSRGKEEAAHEMPMAHGCPSARLQTFIPKPLDEEPVTQTSSLSNWPVQIRLVPPTAPFLKGANLLIAADCAPVAYPNFHRDFLKGKAVMVGCPKFDDVQGYVEKFADIFRSANIKSVTVLDMEVPCCSALPRIVKRGMELAGKNVPLAEVVISARGEILKREEAAA
jgi:ferredoxin